MTTDRAQTPASSPTFPRARLAGRDPNDWDVLALALRMDAPIWTEDQDFFGVGVATWTSRHVERYFTRP